MKIIVANINRIYRKVEELCRQQFYATIVHNNEDLHANLSDDINYIFFLHWSIIIPEKIYTNYRCVVFHMTDLPYGRGGSPLQNLIVSGHSNTKVSAISVQKGLDTGDIYLKRDLSLLGTAEEIFLRAGEIMLDMIREIIEKEPCPIPQTGTPVLFKRRIPEDGNLENCNSIEEVFRYIQMLDADSYPSAFVENDKFRFEFTRASLKTNGIIADVKITRK